MADATGNEVGGKYKHRYTKNEKGPKEKIVPAGTDDQNSPLYYNLFAQTQGAANSNDEAKKDQPNKGNAPNYSPAVPPFLEPGQADTPEPSPRMPRKRLMAVRENGVYYRQMNYGLDQVPPFFICIFLAFQHYLIMFGATMANPLVLMDKLCVEKDDTETRSQIIGTIFVVSGLCTILQCSIGVRLPIVQGGTFTFVTPIIALLSLSKWECPSAQAAVNDFNVTSGPLNVTLNISEEPLWMPRMREVQGAILCASLFQIILGFSGIIGLMLQFIGPLSITPSITLAGFALFEFAIQKSEGQWWITLVTIVLIAAFSQYTKNIKIPCVSFTRGTGFKTLPFPVFKLFPIILAIGITWIMCAVLTAFGVFQKTSTADTSNRLDVLKEAAWFRIPYPGQWGTPTVSSAGVFGLLAGVLASIVESVGDYYACARMARVAPPPVHAINRGIGVEGIGNMIAASFGSGSGTTSYSENIGAIGITKVGSRRVIQVSGMIMILFGIFSKFGAVFVMIPEPIVGGLFIVMFGMIVGIGLSNLQFVDLNSSRNLFIIGFSLFFGITLPKYLTTNPDAIATGSREVDQILTVLLKTSMFVGGLSGFILDNTIPGTDDERGIAKWSSHAPTADGEEADITRTYDLPYINKVLERHSWTRFVPFLPTYDQDRILKCCPRRKNSSSKRVPGERRAKSKSSASDV